MKLDFQNRWLRLLIEFLPNRPTLRRHRPLPSRLDAELGRLLQRQVAHQLRRGSPEEAA
jgi:hypothetical protein